MLKAMANEEASKNMHANLILSQSFYGDQGAERMNEAQLRQQK